MYTSEKTTTFLNAFLSEYFFFFFEVRRYVEVMSLENNIKFIIISLNIEKYVCF